MKRLIASMLVASIAVMLLAGCAVVGGIGGGTYGGLFTQTDAAVAVGSANGFSKVGTSESTAIICFATGDSSIKKAMDNGSITKIHHVDCKVFSVLGLYAKYTTVVYGD